jgi:SP family general alpha glucoside:H+ symporter-like MFS transporter
LVSPQATNTRTAMATVTTNHQTFDITEATPERLELVRKAQEADIAEHGLTIKQALKRYKKAVAWAFALSLCLVMDGYDVSLSRM